ncbi:hypothetical protein KKF04_04630 [Patescibacteria group bacterium]|nr:hypothetical protein [Patescibacteria group bacterium]
MDYRKSNLSKLGDSRLDKVYTELSKNNIKTVGELINLTKTEEQLKELAGKYKINEQEIREYKNKSIEEKLAKQKFQTQQDILDLVRNTSTIKLIINLFFSIFMFATGGYFIYKFITIKPSQITDTGLKLVEPSSAPFFQSAPFWQLIIYLLYLIVGFLFILYAVSTLRYSILLKSFSGISQIQHELLSGLGETRPLVQVVQDTLDNARKTFLQKLVISRAMFWTGLVFVSIALFQILFLGRTDYAKVTITESLTTGGVGIISWIVATFLPQWTKMQDNLDNITQLEFVLVGMAKQLNAVDRLVSEDNPLDEKLFNSSMIALDKNVSRSLALVEMYTKSFEDKDSIFKDILKKEFGI